MSISLDFAHDVYGIQPFSLDFLILLIQYLVIDTVFLTALPNDSLPLEVTV